MIRVNGIEIPDRLLAIQSTETRAKLESTVGRRLSPRAPRWKTAVLVILNTTPAGVVLVFKGLRLVTEGNAGEQLWAKVARAKWQRELVAAALVALVGRRSPALPVHVSIVRVGRRAMDVRDNLPGSCKHLVDALAAWCGVDDADPRFDWSVVQEVGKGYAVRVVITSPLEVSHTGRPLLAQGVA